MNKKGFTLIELLIVIAVLAILTAAVVVVLNPAELLKQARDSQRFSDLDTLKSALSLYVTDVSTLSMGTVGTCYMYGGGTVRPAYSITCGGRATTTALNLAAASTSRIVDGNGWIPVAFSGISGGSPISMLPIDPSHGTTYYYTYIPGSNSTFEINAVLESNKYATGTTNKMLGTNDGGNIEGAYEVGTDITTR